jgi:hypothetical protein
MYYRLAGIIDTTMDPILEAQLLSGMPSLLSTSLPPVGLELQVSYQNVLHRLRRIWLHHAADASTNTSFLDMCKLVQSHLEGEYSSHQLTTVPRTPWRRDSVFKWELKWAAYFVREADLRQRWPEMDQAARDRTYRANRQNWVPPELSGVVMMRGNWFTRLKLWKVWTKEKDGDMEKIESQGYGEGQAKESLTEPDLKKGNESIVAGNEQEEGNVQSQSQDGEIADGQDTLEPLQRLHE